MLTTIKYLNQVHHFYYISSIVMAPNEVCYLPTSLGGGVQKLGGPPKTLEASSIISERCQMA